MTLDITNKNFDSIVLKNSKPIMLDFWAPRCGPCNQLNPHLEELAVDYQADIIVGKVNVDENPELLSNFGVRSIPTVLYLKDGQVVKKLIGYASKGILEKNLKSALLDI